MTEVAIGSEFAGHRIESVAGRGGMGVVYKATHLALNRQVALKLIAPELAEDEGFRERFKHESMTAASIDHPHVIPIYHAGEEGGQLYITMRFVDGTDLRALIAQYGKLEPHTTGGHPARQRPGPTGRPPRVRPRRPVETRSRRSSRT